MGGCGSLSFASPKKRITIRPGSPGKAIMHRLMRRQCLVGFIATFALFAQSAVALCCGSFAASDVTPGSSHPADCPTLAERAAPANAVVEGLADELTHGEHCLHPAAVFCTAYSLPPMSVSFNSFMSSPAPDTGFDHLLLLHDVTSGLGPPGHGYIRLRAGKSAPGDGTSLFLTTRRLRL